MNKRYSLATLGTSALALSAVALIGAGPAMAHGSDNAQGRGGDRTVTLKAKLTELNDSGTSGYATAVVRNQKIQHVTVKVNGATPDAPHAQHIHFGEQARHECPTIALDTDDDGLINTVEGIPAYGPIVVSLTTKGGTTPASALAVDRFPVAEDGSYFYKRDDIKVSKVSDVGTAKEIADAIRKGQGVVVVHGIDYDGNGEYSFSEEGASELDASFPREATDPAACGVLR